MAEAATAEERRWRAHVLPAAIFVLVILISLFVRIRLLNAPLERDEGEDGYIAQTLLAGHAPFELAYSWKLPGGALLYAAGMAVFGQSAGTIRIVLLLVNAATIFLITLLGKRLFGIGGGLFAGASYALLSCSFGVLGTIAHVTHFVVPFALGGTLLMLNAKNRPLRLFAAGLIYGVGFLMKQHGLAFAGLGCLAILWDLREAKASLSYGFGRVIVFFTGVALPYGALCLALWRAGTFPRFWQWTFTLARAFASDQPPATAWANLKYVMPDVIGANLFLWLLAGAGIALALRNAATRRGTWFVIAFFIFCAIAVSGGGQFRNHYFILMLPAIALANGAWIAAAEPGLAVTQRFAAARAVAILCMCGALLYSIAAQRTYLFQMTPYEFERTAYGLNPFPEAVDIADYIRSHSAPDSRIAVLGSEAEIYFYSHRRAATGYIYTYGLMAPDEYALPSQQDAIDEIEASRPAFIVNVSLMTSWLPVPDSTLLIFQWERTYLSRYYEVAGIVDMGVPEPQRYIWAPAAASYLPSSSGYLVIYRRK